LNYLSISSSAEEIDYINRYFQFVEYMLGMELFEFSFNIFDNYGMNSEGNIGLLNIGEFSQSKKHLLEFIHGEDY